MSHLTYGFQRLTVCGFRDLVRPLIYNFVFLFTSLTLLLSRVEYMVLGTVCSRSEKLAKGLAEVLSYVFAHCMGEDWKKGVVSVSLRSLFYFKGLV